MNLKIKDYTVSKLSNITANLSSKIKIFPVTLFILLILYSIILNNKELVPILFMWSFIIVMIYIILLFLYELFFLTKYIIKNKINKELVLEYYGLLITLFRDDIIK
jgi:hypothetical protein